MKSLEDRHRERLEAKEVADRAKAEREAHEAEAASELAANASNFIGKFRLKVRVAEERNLVTLTKLAGDQMTIAIQETGALKFFSFRVQAEHVNEVYDAEDKVLDAILNWLVPSAY